MQRRRSEASLKPAQAGASPTSLVPTSRVTFSSAIDASGPPASMSPTASAASPSRVSFSPSTANSGAQDDDLRDHALDAFHEAKTARTRWNALLKTLPYISFCRRLDLPLDAHPIIILTGLQTVLFDNPRKRFLLDECRLLSNFVSPEGAKYAHFLNSLHSLYQFDPWTALQRTSSRVGRLIPRCGLLNPTPSKPCALIFIIQLYASDLDFREAIIRFSLDLLDGEVGDLAIHASRLERSQTRPVSFTLHLRLLFVQMVMSSGRAVDPSHVLQAFRDHLTGEPIDTALKDWEAFDHYEHAFLDRVHDQMDPYTRALFVSNNRLYKPESNVLRVKMPLKHRRMAIEALVNKDPLYDLSSEDRHLLWESRYHLARNEPKSLAKFLLCVDWTQSHSVQETYRLLHMWLPTAPVLALELLDFKYTNPQIRAFAVDRLEAFTNSELIDFLPQLTQVLKFETDAESPLARFFVRRASEDHALGQYFYWYLKAQIHPLEPFVARYRVILELFVRNCSQEYLNEFRAQEDLVTQLVVIAEMVKDYPLNDRKAVAQGELSKIKFPPRMALPLNPDIPICGLRIAKCKTMDSKKVPLWLVFERADDPSGDPYVVIFKSGDDLRQDLLTLQMFRIMDKLWKSHGLDMKMIPYGCVATGADTGFIEVVLDSDTCANITATVGGGAKGAYDKTTFEKWLRKSNSTFDDYCRAVGNFARSCAAYCVATYVLGIGDRHNDNIMIQRTGKLFHIDFGHFLGNVKSKFGIKRERAPFVFTPDMAFVVGGEDSPSYKDFIDLCCEAYNILRKYADLFLTMFVIMLSTGLPELQKKDDIDYLREALQIGSSDKQAADYFKKLLRISLHSKATQFNMYIHIWKHNNGK